MQSQDGKDVELFSVEQVNATNPGFIEIREGFAPTNPNVGTITHEFTFRLDPWVISARSGVQLATLQAIKLSLSKVFNPNNTTDSFFVLTWLPAYNYRTISSKTPAIGVMLLDVNGGALVDEDLGRLDAICGWVTPQSKRSNCISVYFDRIQTCVFSVGPANWDPC